MTWQQAFWALAMVLAWGPGSRAAGAPARVDAERLGAAQQEAGQWLSHGRDYQETRFSPLKQVDVDSVRRLGLAWHVDLDTARGQEATPLVVDGVLYTSTAWSKVMAVDAATGRRLWSFDPKVPGEAGVKGCCDVVNRGVAVWQGRVYIGTFDGRLIALDAATGKPAWSVLTVDPTQPYTITGAPRVVKGKVLIGNGGAEMGVRGYLSAYDARTGRLAWRFYTTPHPAGLPDGAASDKVLAEQAGPTWFDGDWKRSGGGGTVWDSMSYDPKLDLLYVGVGNGSPFSYRLRSGGRGDNLFLSSIVALRPDTGEYVWHYQTTPGDEWDYTAAQQMILADLPVGGRLRPVLMQAPKNGFFYVLDRATGQLLSADPYATVNWARGVNLDTGRPDIVPEARYSTTGKPWVGQPSVLGAHNWHSMAFDPRTGLVFLPVQEMAFPYVPDPRFERKDLAVNLGVDLAATGLPPDRAQREAIRKSLQGFLVAWDPVARRPRWKVPLKGPWNGGVLATAGGLVVQGTSSGEVVAYRATDGERLWSFPAQTGIVAAPISYEVKGRQYLALMAGWGGAFPLLGNELSHIDGQVGVNRSRLLVFSLDGRDRLPAAAPVPRAVLPPPEPVADPAAAMGAGKALYARFCLGCHGGDAVSGGVLPDLRHSPMVRSKAAFDAVVRHGALQARGMVNFSGVLSERESDLVRDYVLERAREERQP